MIKEEITSMSDLWNSPEWRKASDEFTEGKVCEWCGRKRGDIVTVKDKEIKYILSHITV